MSSIELVHLAPYPVSLINALCRAAKALEVGGVLCGSVEAGIGRIEHASGPGPRAELSGKRLHWDPSYIMGYLDANAARADTNPLGRWHKHCGPDLRASDEDRAGAAAFREALGIDALVDVIVATVHDEPIGWAAYLCTAAGYDQITAELPDGVRG